MALERDIVQALMDRLQQTLLEFGRGYAFVGRQVHLDVDGEDFKVDLLLFHVEQLPEDLLQRIDAAAATWRYTRAEWLRKAARETVLGPAWPSPLFGWPAIRTT